MAPEMYGPTTLVVVLFYLASSSHAKPLTQGMELSVADRLYYFGQTRAQDFELVSPQVFQRRRRASGDKHIDVAFSAFGEKFIIALKPTTGLVNAGTLVHEVGKDGKTVLGQPKEYCLYVGKLLDNKNSTVSASFCGNKLEATITTEKTSIHLQPLKPEHKETDGPTHIVVERNINTDACKMDAERSLKSTLGRKRSADPIYLDASVVADDLMYKTYGNETKDYLLIILNQVAGLLKDPSLGVQVNLKINNIKIIKTPQSDLPVSEELEKSLDSFCAWQKKYDSDISLLVTRRDLVSAGNHKVTGKAADVGGACDPARRCLIGQDHGPSGLIFTLAHEIGHSLGMYHDGGLSDCANKKNIMASVNSGGVDAFRWSECSKNDLHNFLARPEAKCLKDKPKSLPDYTPSSIPMPGYYYNASEQCAMTFNAKSTVASEILNQKDICKALVCKNSKGIPESTNVPPLDGTRCGTKRDICIHGECLKVYSTMDCDGGPCVAFWLPGSFTCLDSVSCNATRLVLCVEEHDDGTTRRVDDDRCPADAKPSDTGVCPDDPCRYAFITGQYGACSVSCGTGIQVRDVLCQDRFADNTVDDSLCTLTAKPATTQICALPACTNAYSYIVENFEPCSVTCGSGVQLRSVTCVNNLGAVVDDSFCSEMGLVKPPTTQNCNTGISCGLRYVPGPYDQCPVTCGIGTRTRMIYCVNDNNVVVAIARCEEAQLIPPTTETTCDLGACPGPVYTVARGEFGQCSVTCGFGTETRLVVCYDNNVQVDLVNCINAGLTDLKTERACTRPNCQPEYRFVSGAFSDCSVTCGTGQRTRDVQCQNQDDQVVDISNCLAISLTPPLSTMECVLENCPTFLYQVGEFGPCNQDCGDGVQLRTVFCVNNDTKAVVDDSNCAEEKPAATHACNLMPCDTMLQFVTSPFSACNCSGLQTRIVICIRRVGTTLDQVDTQLCLDAGIAPQPTTMECTPPPTCVQPDPVWQTTEWIECPVTCGVGTQTRLVYCIEQPGSTTIVDESMCVAEDRPSAVQECDTGIECPTAYLWLTYEWGACSVTCGEGFESRDVFCFGLGDNIVQVEDSLCNAGEKPNTVRPCSLEPCTASWMTSEWSECSVSCGPGTELRSVVCRRTKDPSSNLVDESECIAEDRPSDSRPCYLAICPPPFGCETTYMLEGTVQYTESSPGFTDGENYPNDLACDKAFVASNNIVDGVEPRRVRRNVGADYYIQLTFTAFDVEPSTDCVFDYLEITDLRYNTSERLCGNSYDLPLVWNSVGPHVNMYFHTDATVTRSGYSVIYNAVEIQEPARYVPGEWSECSVTCGEGLETREVLCLRGNETVDESECSGLQKPVSSQVCLEDACVEPSVCSGELLRTEDNTVILSPDFPASYSNNISCFNVIRAPEGMIVEIYSTFFNLRPEECIDRVLIKDVNIEGEPLELCGNQAPGIVFTSITNEVTVTFESAEEGPIPATGFGFSLRANFANQPVVSCGRQISESGRAVYSPNYPGNYNLNENCLTVIRNDQGCIQLRFLHLDLPPQNGECMDFVQLVDLNEVSVNTGPLCGREIPTVFYSFTGLMTVRFFSDENGPTTGGFSAVVNFVDCYEGVWLTGLFGECSATCGEAFRNRSVECHNPQTDTAVDPAMCPPEVPDRVIPCDVPECPSCDVQVTESGEIGSPNSPSNYYNNQECLTEIINTDGCVSINFLAFDLQPGSAPGECDKDFLEISDAAREEPIQLCGSTVPDSYQSLSGNVILTFQTDASVVANGYYAYVAFIPCPVNAFIAGNWSECSVTCGTGMRTREVQCMDLINNVQVPDVLCQGDKPESEEPCTAGEECPSCDVTVTESLIFVISPGFPEPYAPNLECVYSFESPDPSQCVRLTIIEAYLNGPDENGLCSQDYIKITSQSGQPALRFCPESARSIPWYSRDSTATVRFVTDDETASTGFNIFTVFDSCLEYDFEVGVYSECSARCGGGTRSRVVTCINLSDGTTAPDELCVNQRPVDSLPCNTEPCPICDEAFFPGDELIMSPGFSSAPGQGYDTLLDCTYNITNPDGCVFLTFLTFDLQDCDGCECDYLRISENGAEAIPPLCGVQNNRNWASSSSNVMLNFVTDNSVSAPGFNIFVAYVDCPDVYFFTGEFSECDVSCGGGTQTREVYCRSRTTDEEVDESMCAGIKPPSTHPCGTAPCPFCDEVINSPSFIASPEYPAEYPVSINCNYAVSAPQGRCVSMNFLNLDLQPAEGEPAMCDDYVWVQDASNDILGRRYCGTAPANAIQWRSRSNIVTLDFSSDEEETAGGFRAYINFVDCPVYGYEAGEFGVCSRPCGGGTQTREVLCLELATSLPADEANCEDERPPETIPCNIQDCPECNEIITENRQSVYSVNYPQPYYEYSCNYIFTNPGGCVELIFIQFEMPPANAMEICNKDYLLVEDMSDRPFSYRVCGTELPSSIISRGESLNVTLITDGNPATFGEGYQLFNLFSNSCPEVGYVTGEFAQCDRQCGFGTRTREVTCVDLESGITVDESLCTDIKPLDTEFCNTQDCPSCDQVVDTFPAALDSPMDLDPLRTCQYTIESERCIRATFLTFDFPRENGMCGDTFLQLRDEGAEFLTERFCGDGPGAGLGASLYAWDSRTSDVVLTLNSGTELMADNRFRIFMTEMNCPEYGFFAGEFSECSNSCGEGGTQTRTVECQLLADNSPASEELCTDPKPPATRPCAPQPPCPSCDMFVTDPETLVQGPPRNGNWTTDVRCQIVIEFEADCVAVSGLQVMLSEPDVNDTCVDSSLTFSDGTYEDYTETVCGTSSGGVYRALTNRYVVDFFSADYENSADSFNLFVQSSACPVIEYQTGEFSQCSVSCGGGIQTRDVTCVRTDTMEVVPDAACAGDRPPAIESCNLIECPKECENVITVNTPVMPLSSPGRPTYVTDSDCTNNIVNLSGCIILSFLSFDIEEGTMPGVCDKDYLEIIDATFDELNVRLCGDTIPSTAWRSKSGLIRTRFVSDDVDTQQTGYNIIYTLSPTCPTGSYVLSDFSECSVSCGEGTRTAGSVDCVLPDQSIGASDDCPGLPPSPVESCNLADCNEYFWDIGEWSNCSVECGDGVQTRTVNCSHPTIMGMIDDAMCPEDKPAESQPCIGMDCANNYVLSEPAQTYTLALNDMGTIQSPNFPIAYPNNLNAQVIFNIPPGTLLRLTIDTLDLVFESPCASGDFLRFSSGTNTVLQVCQAMTVPFDWFSGAGDTEVTIAMTTSATVAGTGFMASWSVFTSPP